MLTGIGGKTKREIRELLSVVTLDGRVLEQEPTVELKVTLTRSQAAKLDRAFEVLAACGHTPEMSQVLEQALDALLWRRNEGRCSWRYSNGERCSEKKMLEIDNITMVCRGGDNNGENLTLRCRFHNQVRAEQLLGAVFMEGKRHQSLNILVLPTDFMGT